MSRFGSSERSGLGRRGATALEFALVANTLLLLLLGSIEMGRYFFVSESMRYLVGEVARATIIDPDAAWTDAKKAAIAAKTPILQASDLTLTVNVNRQTAPATSVATVTGSYRYQFTLPYLSGLVNGIRTGVTLRFVATPLP